MREKFMQFMNGRYGADQLSRFMVFMAMGAMIVNLFLRWRFFHFFTVLLLILCYFRMFSKNHSRRYAENLRFTQFTAKYRYWLEKQRNRLQQRKIYHIYKCPSCKQKVRVPRGKGTILITCPKCRTEFQKKS